MVRQILTFAHNIQEMLPYLISGVREFLAKPYTMPQMLQLVRRVLDGN